MVDNFVEITLDISRYYGISIDLRVNDKMLVKECIYETLQGLNLALLSIDNIVLKVDRNAVLITQSEMLAEGDIRNGDVLILL